MRIRLVHKASGSYRGHLVTNNSVMTKERSTFAAQGSSDHKPSASNFDSTNDSFALNQIPDGFDAAVSPYDPDNDYFPDENMTDAEAAEEAARLRREEVKEGREFNLRNHGHPLPDQQQTTGHGTANATGNHAAAAVAPPARPARTCDRCKTLRKGCDKAVPTCGRCQARGQACVYSRG
ncbi:hypothetical protein QM012_002632 [Aureobasidium pullulans]|uniref:Zn(2)-C6 fungal-type domain-containing protein n=1 Tax=Aureobasidium pullulans TaxID=5580 RepID=A0ABR0TBB1_AURPU